MICMCSLTRSVEHNLLGLLVAFLQLKNINAMCDALVFLQLESFDTLPKPSSINSLIRFKAIYFLSV